MNFDRQNSLVLGAVLFALAPVGGLFACGINWAQPKSHFEGVSFQGYVFLVEEMGNIELKSGQKLPLRAIFRSESNQTSPYVGNGWEIPLLESQIVQMDERFFRLVEPSGWFRLFWRDEKDPAVLHGQGNWKGTIRENSISLVADCGSRLDYRDGKLISMQIKDEKLDVLRNLDGTASIVQGMVTLLTIGNSLSNENTQLRVGNAAPIEISLADRPLVEVVANQTVIGKQVKSLASIGTSSGPKREFAYRVDESRNPTINLGNRKIVWNPSDRLIVADAKWKYQITPDKNHKNVAIRRTDPKGRSEFWQKDDTKGIELTEGSNGIRKVTTSFASGKLLGQVRKREEIVNGVNKVVYQARYNENGVRFQEIIGDQILDLHYDDKGRLTQKTDAAGQLIWERSYDAAGQLIRKVTSGNRFDFERNPDGSYLRLQKDVKTGAVLQRSIFDREGRNTEFNTRSGDFYRIAYGTSGHKEKMFRNGMLIEAYVFDDATGKQLKEIAFRPGSTAIESMRVFGVEETVKIVSGGEISPNETATLLKALPWLSGKQ